MQQLFPNRSTVKVRALFLGGRLELKGLESSRVLAALPLMISAGEQGYAELFRYGAVVLFNVSPVEEMSILHHLRPLLRDPFETPDTEVTEITVDPDKDERVDNNIIIVKDTSPERLQVVADIFAKSVVLDHYEQRVAGAFDRIEPLADHLQRHGRTEYRATELLRHIGGTLLIQQTTVGRVEVGETPEILWERPDLERLYVRLEDGIRTARTPRSAGTQIGSDFPHRRNPAHSYAALAQPSCRVVHRNPDHGGARPRLDRQLPVALIIAPAPRKQRRTCPTR